MEIEITRTENGFHCKDKEAGGNGDNSWCFETPEKMFAWLRDKLPINIGGQITIKD